MSVEFGPISELGRRYLEGSLRQQQLQGNFSPSAREDVLHNADLGAAQRNQFIDAALAQLHQGAVAFAVLAAGASSRMHLGDIPAEVADMVRASGRSELPTSKALVPVVKLPDDVLSYLDLFLINVRRFSEATGTPSRAILFVSEANQEEIAAYLRKVNYRGLPPDRLTLFVQPLEPQIVATEHDIRRAEKNFPGVDMQDLLALAKTHAGHDLPQRKPGGHGEFLHQLVASGTLSKLLKQGVRYIAVRNIDNTAALIDDQWLAAFGYLLTENADMLVEVAQRPHGQKGGALIRQNGRWRIAEDPSFAGTKYHAADSYYINAAVAILRVEYFYPIYETSAQQLIEAADDPSTLEIIAQRGRAKFPTLIDAKPVKLSDGRTVAAVTPETNMWESTGVDERVKVLPMAVDSDRDAGTGLAELPAYEQRRRALRVRFSPTKSWADYEDPNKQVIARLVAERIVSGQLFEDKH